MIESNGGTEVPIAFPLPLPNRALAWANPCQMPAPARAINKGESTASRGERKKKPVSTHTQQTSLRTALGGAGMIASEPFTFSADTSPHPHPQDQRRR